MKVLHVIPAIAPRYGGPSAAAAAMCAALARRPGLQVHLAATDADGAGGRLDLAAAAAFPVPLFLFRRDLSESWKYSRDLAAWLHRHAREYDLLHVHGLWSFATLAAARAARRHGVPFVLRPCGMLSDYTWGRSPWKKRLYWHAVERCSLTAARAIHATSAGEAAEVRALLMSPSPELVVIPNGVDDAAWTAERQPDHLCQRCGFPVGRPILLFLSRLHPKKGLVDFLLPAFARLRADAYLAVAGGADDHEPGHEAAVRQAVAHLGLADRVVLLGRVRPDERWALYDGAAVFVLPSRSENFGIVVAEALARGVPVVVSDQVQAAEHVAAAGAGRIVPLAVDALSAALDGLLADPSGAADMGRRGRDYARLHLAWPALAERIAGLYESCAGRFAGLATPTSSAPERKPS